MMITMYVCMIADIGAFLEDQGVISSSIAHTVSVLISAALFASYPLQLYPALEVCNNHMHALATKYFTTAY